MPDRHPLLRRQIRRALPDAVPDGLGPFLDLVDAAYAQGDDDRDLIERALDLTSRELMEQNDRLREELAEREVAQRRLREEVELHRQTASARDQAEELLRLKSSFLANMSHELRTPLTGILGYAELLQDELVGDAQEMVAVIQRSATRLYETVNSVLDLAQLDSGGVRLALGPTDLRAEAAEAVALLASVAAARGLELRLAPGPDVVAVADRSAVHRVLNNLIGNALKFTASGGVTVSVTAEGGGAEVRVHDTGPGIPAAFLPHLYDAFRQASDGHARAYEGNGLGLAITARLVELMAGDVTVERTSAEGSIFRVRLPLAEAPAASPAACPALAPGEAVA